MNEVINLGCRGSYGCRHGTLFPPLSLAFPLLFLQQKRHRLLKQGAVDKEKEQISTESEAPDPRRKHSRTFNVYKLVTNLPGATDESDTSAPPTEPQPEVSENEATGSAGADKVLLAKSVSNFFFSFSRRVGQKKRCNV